MNQTVEKAIAAYGGSQHTWIGIHDKKQTHLQSRKNLNGGRPPFFQVDAY